MYVAISGITPGLKIDVVAVAGVNPVTWPLSVFHRYSAIWTNSSVGAPNLTQLEPAPLGSVQLCSVPDGSLAGLRSMPQFVVPAAHAPELLTHVCSCNAPVTRSFDVVPTYEPSNDEIAAHSASKPVCPSRNVLTFAIAVASVAVAAADVLAVVTQCGVQNIV